MSGVKVFLGGEGPNELGGWACETAWRPAAPDPGVIEALLRAAKPEGWAIIGAKRWKDIRKFRTGDHRDAEARTLLGLALHAREGGAAVLVALRDTDGDAARRAVLDAAVAALPAAGPTVVAAWPDPKVEAWICALKGDRSALGAGRMRADAVAQRLGLPPKDTASMVTAVREADWARLPADCPVRGFYNRAKLALETP